MSKRKTILLIDDNRDILDTLSSHLKEKNYYIINAPNAEVSLRLMQELKVNLVITDLAMPGMNGFEFIKLVRVTLGEKNLPKMIVYTGYKDMLGDHPSIKHVDKIIDKLTDVREVVDEAVKLIEG